MISKKEERFLKVGADISRRFVDTIQNPELQRGNPMLNVSVRLLPPDVRKGCAFPAWSISKGRARLRRVSERRSLRPIFEYDTESQRLSAHRAAEPKTKPLCLQSKDFSTVVASPR